MSSSRASPSSPTEPRRQDHHSMYQEQLRRLWQYQMFGDPHSHDNPAMSPRLDGSWHSMTKRLTTSKLQETIESRGLSTEDAFALANIAQEQLRELHFATGQPVSLPQLVEGIKKLAAAETEELGDMEQEPSEASDESDGGSEHLDGPSIILDYDFGADPLDYWWSRLQTSGIDMQSHSIGGSTMKKFTFKDWVLDSHWGGEDPYETQASKPGSKMQLRRGTDILSAMCQCTELAIELGKHLRVEDIVTLFSTSRAFNYSVSDHLLSSVKKWIAHKAPEAGRIFAFQLYRRHLVPDPTGRTWRDMEDPAATAAAKSGTPHESRRIPGLRYLQMVVNRDRCCREMIAIMARNGHLMPKTMHKTLLRLWLLMEISTSHQRRAFLQNEQVWTDYDLYNGQFFFVKLCLHFNDPIYGPSTHDLLHLMMGQKGLYPLWQLLMRKRFTRLAEVVQLKARYDFAMPNCGRRVDQVHGVPRHLVGIGHLEGWGLGTEHLDRPDELIPVEAVRRGLELDKHLMHMVLWGYFDWKTGENIVPTEEDLYISDDERVLAHADTTHHWKPKHAMKKRFAELNPEQQRAIIDQDEDDRLRALAWCSEDVDHDESSSDEDAYSLDDELHRGYIVAPVPKDAPPPPLANDQAAWINFVNEVMLELPPEMDEDEALRAQAWQSYQHGEASGSWDWKQWLKDQPDDDESGDDAACRFSTSGDSLPGLKRGTADDGDDEDDDDDDDYMDED